MTTIEAGNKVSIFFQGHGMQSASKLTLKLHSLIIKKQNMKTEESIFVCNQNTFTSGVYNYWAPGRLKFCLLTFNIFTIIVAFHSFSCTKKCISSNEPRRKNQATLRPIGNKGKSVPLQARGAQRVPGS